MRQQHVLRGTSIHGILAVACLFCTLAVLPGQDRTDEIAKWIAQLGAADFRTREQAGKMLEMLGEKSLPELRKAKGNGTPESNRRVDLVIERIETNLVKAEEKTWKDLDASQRGIRERVLKLVGRISSDADLVSAVYLICTGQRPTEMETRHAQQQLSKHRLLGALKLARGQVESKQFNRDIAVANARVLKLQTDLGAAFGVPERFRLLNRDDSTKVAMEIRTSLAKAAKADATYCDLAFLVTCARFPKTSESNTLLNFLKGRNGDPAGEVVWAIINSAEFLKGN
ncbi:MAG TPA: hypothetical protein VFE62_15130 [Gemmataceae bacterium]|nr:hypothetical protein [Gemmataceae bacterium]